MTLKIDNGTVYCDCGGDTFIEEMKTLRYFLFLLTGPGNDLHITCVPAGTKTTWPKTNNADKRSCANCGKVYTFEQLVDHPDLGDEEHKEAWDENL